MLLAGCSGRVDVLPGGAGAGAGAAAGSPDRPPTIGAGGSGVTTASGGASSTPPGGFGGAYTGGFGFGFGLGGGGASSSSPPSAGASSRGGSTSSSAVGGAAGVIEVGGASAGGTSAGGTSAGGAITGDSTAPPPMQVLDTSSVLSLGPDQMPSADTCGGCAANQVCHPGVGCEPACDIATGVDPNAAWPLGGGCATRRGLSRFSGPKSAKVAFAVNLGNYPAPYSSALTIGPNREIYVPGEVQNSDGTGFVRIERDGSATAFADWLAEVPVIAQNGNLYTVPMGMQATDHAGNVLWTTPVDANAPANVIDQEGEPVIGADGTIYAPGSVGDGTTGLIAISPQGNVVWSLPTNVNIGSETWPAVASDGTIYFGDGSGTLWSVSAQGTKKWSVDLGDFIWGYPAIDHAQNVFAGNGANFWSFTPEGKTRFEVQMTTDDQDFFVFGHPAIAPDGTVFITYLDQLDEVLTSGIIAFSNDGVQLWKRVYSDYGISPPLVDRDGTVYFIEGPTVRALNANGDELWSQVLQDDGACSGAVAIAADGTLLVECTGKLVGIRE